MTSRTRGSSTPDASLDRQIVCQTTRLRHVQGVDAYPIELVDLLASFPDFTVEVRDIAVLEGPELGLRIAVLWLLRGACCNGPCRPMAPSRARPLNVLGVCHFEMRDGKVLREFRVVDEIARSWRRSMPDSSAKGAA